MNRSIPDPFQLSGKGSRSDQDPKKVECDPDRELLRSVPAHVWANVREDIRAVKSLQTAVLKVTSTGEKS